MQDLQELLGVCLAQAQLERHQCEVSALTQWCQATKGISLVVGDGQPMERPSKPMGTKLDNHKDYMQGTSVSPEAPSNKSQKECRNIGTAPQTNLISSSR